jgi:protein SCO1/2
MSRKYFIPLGLALILSGALAYALFVWQPASPPTHRSLNLAGPPQGGDFVLDSADGPVKLEDFRGKVVLLYFGYTLCPDICPTNLAAVARALSVLEAEETAQVRVIFVSVDPQRDELPRLKTYAAYFHPTMLGASGSEEVIAEVARRYGAAYRKVETGSALGYMVDHSAYTYLIDRHGKLRGQLEHAASPNQILDSIRALLAES